MTTRKFYLNLALTALLFFYFFLADRFGVVSGTKLQNIIKKYGYKYVRGSGFEALDPNAVPTPRAKATPKKRKKAEADEESKDDDKE